MLISYGGITFPYGAFVRFHEDSVPDPSGTDNMLVRFDIAVACTINANYLAALAPTLVTGGQPVSTNPAVLMKALRQRLRQKRMPLSVRFDGNEYIPQQQPNNLGSCDAKNGPNPIECDYQNLTTTSWYLTWHVEAHYWENNLVTPGSTPLTTNQLGSPVLSRRWSESVSIDVNQMRTRVRDGRIVLRTDNTFGFTADDPAIRGAFAILAVPPEWQRVKSMFNVDPDGTVLSFHVEDQERYKMPPPPAYEAEGEYTESVSEFSAYRFADCRVLLRGNKNTDQAALINTALQVVLQKLQLRGSQIGGGPTGGFKIIKGASVRQGLYENEVEVAVRAMYAITSGSVVQVSGAAGGIGAFQGLFTATPLSDPMSGTVFFSGAVGGSPLNLYQPSRGVYGGMSGTANFPILLAAAYWDPNLAYITVGASGTIDPKTGIPVQLDGLTPQTGLVGEAGLLSGLDTGG